MELTSEHSFYFGTKGKISARDLADSLIGLERVVTKGAEIIKSFIPQVKVSETEVFISGIEFGSYKDNFYVRMILGKGKALEKNLEKLRKKLGLQKLDMTTVIKLVLAAAVCYGIYMHFKPGDPARITIENSFNNIGAGLNMTKDEVLALMDSAIKNKEDLKKSVQRFAAPAAGGDGAEIKIDGDKSLTIPKEVTKELPRKYRKPDKEEMTSDQQNVQLSVRALDLDHASRGWAAIAPDIDERRLPLEIADGVDTATIPSGRLFAADITIHYKLDRHKRKKPASYTLQRVVPIGSATAKN